MADSKDLRKKAKVRKLRKARYGNVDEENQKRNEGFGMMFATGKKRDKKKN